MTPKCKQQEKKIDKLNFIKLKNFCVSKDTVKKVKRQPTEWGKIFANQISNKGPISRIYKELITQ